MKKLYRAHPDFGNYLEKQFPADKQHMDDQPSHWQSAARDAHAEPPQLKNGRQIALDEALGQLSLGSRAKGAVMLVLAAAAEGTASIVEYWKVAASALLLVVAVEIVARHL
ncbi:MAG TPA: hypothetical protein VLV50_00565 [Stellaceae bacterium]|nr:hypothetical protein [Stellaceae bacterium]